MTKKARLWTGVTIFAVVALNYVIIGAPLIKMSQTINVQTRSILLKQAKTGQLFNNPEDEYIMGVFRKERAAVDRKILILNCISASIALLAASWTLFGLAAHKKKQPHG